MVDVEDILSGGEGPERRVDMAKLVLYLHSLSLGLGAMDTRLTDHMAAEEEQQKQVAQLLIILTQAKGLLTVIRWGLYIIAPLLAAGAWFKDHFPK